MGKNVVKYLWGVLVFAVIVGLICFFYHSSRKTPLALPEFHEVSLIRLEEVIEGVGYGEVSLSDSEAIAEVLASLQGSYKTTKMSLNDVPLVPDYLKVYIDDPVLQRIYVYKQGDGCFVEEAYMGVYKAKAEVYRAIEKIYLSNGGNELQEARKALWGARTNYVGDNSAVGQILWNLSLPEGIVYDGFELVTDEHPYTVRVKLKVEELLSDEFPNTAHEAILTKNAIILFSLVENLELVYFEYDDAHRERGYQLADSIASTHLGDDYFALTETFRGFNLVLNLIN